MDSSVKQVLGVLRSDIDAALLVIAKKHGVEKLHLGSCTYSRAGSFTFKLEGVMDGGLDKDAERYKESTWLGLPPLASEVKINGALYRAVGLNTTGSKVIMALGEKRFLFKTDDIKRLAQKQGLVALPEGEVQS